MTQYVLQVEKLSKSFGTQPILEDFSFQLEPGQICSVLGKSGTGKTTLMRILNNLEKCDGGTIVLDGQSLVNEGHYVSRQEQKVYQGKIGLVFQDNQLFPNLTVLANLMEAPLAQKLSTKSELEEKAIGLLRDLGLEDKAAAMPKSLSGGQKQRVAIARALMLEPKVICFDEPTSALDEESIQDLIPLIKACAQKGIGVLIITHNQTFAQNISDQVLESAAFLKA